MPPGSGRGQAALLRKASDHDRGAKRVLDACAKANKVLGVGRERRYEECFELVGRLIADGALGKPLMFDANIRSVAIPMTGCQPPSRS
jgi:predicted dehydrogenase